MQLADTRTMVETRAPHVPPALSDCLAALWHASYVQNESQRLLRDALHDLEETLAQRDA